MPALLQAQWETAFGTTFTGTPVLPHYGRGDVVWRKSEFAGATSWQGNRSYEVVSITILPFDDSGTERIADSTGDTEVTNAGTQPDDTTTGWWYVIANPNNGTEYTVHESDLLDEADMETYVNTLTGAFIG